MSIIASLGPWLLPPAGAEGPQSIPAWYEAGLSTLVDHLWLNATQAVGETSKTIDHGDLWAWTGDNAKVLSAMASSERVHGDAAAKVADFVLRMHEGPLLFKRWANTNDPLVVQDDLEAVEVSNHLITLKANRTGGRVDAILEYHDGRNKRMASFGTAEVRMGDRWAELGESRTATVVVNASGRVGIEHRYSFPGFSARETFTIDAFPRVEHDLEVSASPSPIQGARFVFDDLEVTASLRDVALGHYRRLIDSEGASRTIGSLGAGLVPVDQRSGPWFLLLDPGLTDEFASGLLVRTDSSFQGLAVRSTSDTDPNELRSMATEQSASPGSNHWTADVALLDGVLTGQPKLYGPLAENLTQPRLAGTDLGLTYEYSETILGLLDYANATGDAAALQSAKDLLEGYLGFYQRGTQTRSLGSGVLAALRLWSMTGEARWMEVARQMGEVLHGYQVEASSTADAGSVINEPGGGPFLDSTILAARAWHALALASGDARFRAWSDAAWQSLQAEGDAIFLRGSRADDNEWAFKTGLVLQGAPDIPESLLWAARNHAWTVVRDLGTFEAHTSRYSPETNSETQAWVLLGLVQDWKTRRGPWIVDSEGYLERLPSADPDVLRVRPPWPGAYVWAEPGWIAHEDGVPAAREPGPLGTWRYTADGNLTFWPSERRPLPAGIHALGFPGVGSAASPARLFQNLPVSVAWSYNTSARRWDYWAPGGSGTLRETRPGQGFIVALDVAATVEGGAPPPSTPALSEGWNLVVAPSGNETPTPEGPFAARFVAVGRADSDPPVPPMLVRVHVDQPYAYRLRGGVTTAGANGTGLAEGRLDVSGSSVLVVDAPSGPATIQVQVAAPDGRQVGNQEIAFRPGAAVAVVMTPPSETTPAPGGVLLVSVLAVSGAAVVGLALAFRRVFK